MGSVPLRRSVALAIALVLALLAASCSSDEKVGSPSTTKPGGTTGSTVPKRDFNQPDFAGTPKQGGAITFGVESNIATLDPAGNLVQPSDVDMALAIYDPLVTRDDKGNYAPALATEWTNSDDLETYTLTLRSGVVFQDGAPFDADAVVTDFDRLKDPKTNCACAPQVALIKSVVAKDPSTVVFTLTQPNAFFLSQLTGSMGFIASPKAIAKYGADYARHPVGTGPFSLESFDSLVLKKNPRYWQKDDKGVQLPYLDKITVKPIADAGVRLQSLQAGDVDMLQTADTGTIVDAVKDGTLKIQKITGSSATIIIFNTRKPPFNDVRARQAAAYGLNRQELNNILYQGSREDAYSPFPVDSPYYADVDWPHFDLAKAKDLVAKLKADGVPTKFTSTCIATPEGRGGLTVIQRQAKSYGVTINTEFLDQGAYVNKVLGPAHDFVAGCFRSPQIADADGLYNSLHTGGSTNPMGYSNKTVDKALDDIRTTTDEAKQKELLKVVQEQIAKDVPSIPILYDLFANIYSSKVSGLPVPQQNSLGAIRFTTLYLKG